MPGYPMLSLRKVDDNQLLISGLSLQVLPHPHNQYSCEGENQVTSKAAVVSLCRPDS
jgi:hypothetical protein